MILFLIYSILLLTTMTTTPQSAQGSRVFRLPNELVNAKKQAH